jgi:hypothetical protein
MKHKYLVKNNNEEFYFDKKNDFIIYCQSQYNDWYKIHTQSKNSSYNKLQNIEITFSYDGGQTWNDIADFKHVRQLIQNEKKLTSSLQNNDSSEKTNSGNSWFTYLSIIFFIWCALSFLNVKVKRIGFINDFNTSVFGRESKLVRPNSFNKIAIEESQSDDKDPITQTTIDEYNSSDNETEESNINSASNSITSNDNRQICSSCEGKGFHAGCNQCTKGKKHCTACGGIGFYKTTSGKTCVDCSGTGIIYCPVCNGDYINHKRECITCEGRKFTKYIEKDCFFCGGDGYDDGNNKSCIFCQGSGRVRHVTGIL